MTEPTYQQFLEFAKGKAIAAMIDAGLNPVEGDVELLAMFMMRGARCHGPNIETLTMPLADFLPTVRFLTQGMFETALAVSASGTTQ